MGSPLNEQQKHARGWLPVHREEDYELWDTKTFNRPWRGFYVRLHGVKHRRTFWIGWSGSRISGNTGGQGLRLLAPKVRRRVEEILRDYDAQGIHPFL